MNDPPASAASAGSGVSARASALSRTEARQAALARRAQVRARQQVVRARAAETGAEILGSVDLVGNALFVRTPPGVTREDLASIEGVRRVIPVRLFHRVLDRAVGVHHVDQVWARLGIDNAGAGVKIGIIDSGVDNNHPGLQDASLKAPDGFPQADTAADNAFTNSKVIVARSYVSLLSNPRDPDQTARDRVGHGTALAMIAAGNTNTGPLGPITGVAPRAYIGSYKIFGTPGINDGATDDAILKAIEDAVADGMDVISMSFGSNLASRLEDDPDVAAIENAAALGIITVAAAGNEGPDFTSLSSPGTAPSAITVGASHNDRTFSPSATVSGLSPFITVNSSRPGASAINGPLVDAEAIDGNGLVCSALPASSLSGKVVLILRGVCTFETKLTYAARAGAVGALVYTDAARPDAISMDVGLATLPAQMLNYADGVAVKSAIAAGSVDATLDFSVKAVLVNPNRMASFSSAGPSVDYGIKPEIVAVGTDYYTATQNVDSRGDMYGRTGYIAGVDGTSFSTPFIAGVAALLKSSRPGLTVQQYRSLIINTAMPLPQFHAQISGSGMVDADAATRSTVTATPAVLGLGVSDGSPATSFQVDVRNLDGADDTYEVAVESKFGGAAPVVDTPSLAVPGGSTASFHVAWNGSAIPAGTYEGYIVLRGASSGNTLRIPYWHAVRSEPSSIYPAFVDNSPRAFALDKEAIYFRVLDASGVALLDPKPEVTVVSGSATVVDVYSIDKDLPGAFAIDLQFGSLAASSVIQIKSGNAVRQVSIP